MSDNNIFKPIVLKALEDQKFAEGLKNEPRATLEKYGFELPEEEMQKIEQVESLEELASPGIWGGVVIF